MNKIITFILSALLSLNSFAQVVQYHYDRKLEYKLGNSGETLTAIFSSNETAPVITSEYVNGFGKDFHSTISWLYTYKDKLFQLDGKLMNGKYVSVQSYSDEFKPSTDKTFSLHEKRWTVDEKECNMYYIPNNGSEFRVFVYDRGDGENYNEPNNALLRTLTLPSLNLNKGEVILRADIYGGEDKQFILFENLQDAEPSFHQSIVINQKNIDLTLGGTDEEHWNFINATPYPNYCEVIGWKTQPDKVTEEKITEFFGDMCTYFNLFGRYDLPEFQAYYLREIAYRASHFQKFELLTPAQATIFIKELNAHIKENMKENLMK